MYIRIRLEHLLALIAGLVGVAALFTVWFSRAILVFRLDEYAGGELDEIAQLAFPLAPAQLALLTLGGLLVIAAIVVLVLAAIRKPRQHDANQ